MTLINLYKTFYQSLCVLTVLMLSACASKPSSENSIVDSNEVVRFEQAIDLLKEKKLAESRKIFSELHVAHPEFVGPIFNLGLIGITEHDFELAKTRFEQVLALKSQHIGALVSLAYIAREEGRFDDAEARYLAVLSIEPDNVKALRNLGILLDLYRGRLQEALVLYERYQSLQAKEDPQLKDWIFDLKARIAQES